MSLEEARRLVPELGDRWELATNGRALLRQITFKTFQRAMAFLNPLGGARRRRGTSPGLLPHTLEARQGGA